MCPWQIYVFCVHYCMLYSACRIPRAHTVILVWKSLYKHRNIMISLCINIPYRLTLGCYIQGCTVVYVSRSNTSGKKQIYCMNYGSYHNIQRCTVACLFSRFILYSISTKCYPISIWAPKRVSMLLLGLYFQPQNTLHI